MWTKDLKCSPIFKVTKEIPDRYHADNLTVLSDWEMADPVLGHQIAGIMCRTSDFNRDQWTAHDGTDGRMSWVLPLRHGFTDEIGFADDTDIRAVQHDQRRPDSGIPHQGCGLNQHGLWMNRPDISIHHHGQWPQQKTALPTHRNPQLFERKGDCTEHAKLLSIKRRLGEVSALGIVRPASCDTDILLLYFRHSIALV